MVRVAPVLEAVSAILEVTEQTAGVAGGGDVVVDVGDERHRFPHRFSAPAVREFEHPLLALGVDTRRLGAGSQQLDGVVDGEADAVRSLLVRVLEGLVSLGHVLEIEPVRVEVGRLGHSGRGEPSVKN